MTCLVLFTSLGGTTYPWGSPGMIAFAVAGAVLLGVFVVVERRAVEPMLPLHLFSNRGFSSTSVVGFIVGLALFGAVTYLPVFFQIVHGESPTTSGLQLLPLLAGLIVFSTTSGAVISRTGRYRVFPIAGTALITVGILLLSQVGVATSLVVAALFMFVLGVGLGCVMQVLVLIVQNAVPYSELGVATSGATFFRSIGGPSAPRSSARSSRMCSPATSFDTSARRSCPRVCRARDSRPRSSTGCRTLSSTASPPRTRSRFRRCSSLPRRSAPSHSSPRG